MMSFQPTFYGFVPETQDALMLFQAVVDGRLPLVTSRPPESERWTAIQSGYVYIFKEGTIKRWTDKVSWSPSRVLGNFLVYRELRAKRSASNTPNLSKYEEQQRVRQGPMYTHPRRAQNIEFSLYGSLIDSYDFKERGLVKKTISTSVGNEVYRLISYYSAEDVLSGNLATPMDRPDLVNIQVGAELTNGLQFRMPLHNLDLDEILYTPHPDHEQYAEEYQEQDLMDLTPQHTSMPHSAGSTPSIEYHPVTIPFHIPEQRPPAVPAQLPGGTDSQGRQFQDQGQGNGQVPSQMQMQLPMPPFNQHFQWNWN